MLPHMLVPRPSIALSQVGCEGVVDAEVLFQMVQARLETLEFRRDLHVGVLERVTACFCYVVLSALDQTSVRIATRASY